MANHRTINIATKIFIMFILIVLLAGCNVIPEPVDSFKEVKVTDKHTEPGYRATLRYITIEKNGNSASFKVDEEDYSSIKKGTIINADLNRNGYLINIKYPSLN